MARWDTLRQGQRARKPARRTVCLWGQPDPHTRALLAQCVAEDHSIALVEVPESESGWTMTTLPVDDTTNVALRSALPGEFTSVRLPMFLQSAVRRVAWARGLSVTEAYTEALNQWLPPGVHTVVVLAGSLPPEMEQALALYASETPHFRIDGPLCFD